MKKINNKRGFTLVELLSVVVILGIITSITILLIMNNINKSRENTKLITYNNIKKMAATYNDEVSAYWNTKDNYEYSCLSLGNMIELGYFDENIINENNGLNRDTMMKVVRDKDSKVIKETSFSFENSILPDVDCNYQSSVLISTNDLSRKVKEVNAKILYNTLDSDYSRYFYLSGFSDNSIITIDKVYSCTSIANCSNELVSNLESGHWYLTTSDLVRLNIKSNGTITALVNYNGESVAEATKEINATFDFEPPVINVNVYKIGSYEGENLKTKGDLITTIGNDYIVSEWNNYGYWFDISTNENVTVKWTYNDTGTVVGNKPTNTGGNCNYVVGSSPCYKTLSGDGERKAIIEAIDEAGNSSNLEITIHIDRTPPELKVTEQRCTDSNNCLSTLIGDKIEKTANKTNNNVSIDDKTWSFNGFNLKYIAKDNMSNIKEIRILQNSSGIYDRLSTEITSNETVINNNNKIILDSGQRYIQIIAYDIAGNSSIINITGYISNKITISYNGNGGSGSISNTTIGYGQSFVTATNAFTRTGYTFLGWSTKSDNTDDGYNWTNFSGTWKYVNGEKGITNDKLTLYARWKINTYTISYNANSGTGAPSSQTKTYGTDLTLSSTKPTRTGYTFQNWNTKADGSGDSYASGATYTSNEPVTLYAIWKINDATPPTCTLSANASSITASASDDGGSGLAYNGWSSSYSGSNSVSKSIATGTHTYYVKDGAGNTNSCSITIARTTKSCPFGYWLENNDTICYKGWYVARGSCSCRGKSTGGGFPVVQGFCSMSGGSAKCSCPSGTWEYSSSCYRDIDYETADISYECSDNSYTQINDSYCYK